MRVASGRACLKLSFFARPSSEERILWEGGGINNDEEEAAAGPKRGRIEHTEPVRPPNSRKEKRRERERVPATQKQA